MATRRRPSSKAQAESLRRPSLQWKSESAAGLLPHELEADTVGVLVGLIEWTTHMGLDFEAMLSRARTTVAERRGTATKQHPPASSGRGSGR